MEKTRREAIGPDGAVNQEKLKKAQKGLREALTTLEFVETYGDICGVELPGEFVRWAHSAGEILPEIGANWHSRANMCPDRTLISSSIGYRPQYTPEETLERAVRWMFDEGPFED